MNLDEEDSELLKHLIAFELDKPSVYMSGPTASSRRKAEAIILLVEYFYKDTNGSD